MRLFLIFRNIKVEEVFIAMENTNELHNDNPLQSLTLCLDSAQIRQLLATIDFRENDVFRHTFGSEDELSRRIRIAYLSDLFLCRFVRTSMMNTEPVKNHQGEKGIRFDLLIKAEDDQGNSLVINLEMQNYQMSDSLAMRSQGYLSRIVADQLCVGDPYEFNPVIQVMLTNHVPQIQKNDGYLHDYRYTKEEKAVPLPDERCRILWVEMDKLEALEKKPVEEWRLSEKIHYTVRFSHAAEKQKIIQELSEKEEIIQMMEEKKMDFLRDTNLALARMRAKFDERDEQVVYEKGIAKGKEEGKLEGQKMLVKLVLRQRMTLNEWEEKQIDELDEEKLLDLIQSLDAIHTPEDFQRQIHDKINQNVHLKQTVLNR